jgi:SPP1 family predicted phage head-tail adaptor
VWAAIEPLSTKELLHAQQISAELSVKIRIRFNNRVSAEDGVIYGDRIFEIVGPPINVDEVGAEMILMCKEIA